MNRVGVALRDGKMTSEDERLLEAFITLHQQAADEVRTILAGIGLTAVGRAKSRGTLREKLIRLSDYGLARIDDAAGARIILEGGRGHQDRVVHQIVQAFTLDGASPRVKDRRLEPSHGYRAVHVMTRLGDCLVEIQVRTQLQHAWAELVEGLGDLWGRELRYGLPVQNPEAQALVSQQLSRHELKELLGELADVIAEHEIRAQRMRSAGRALRSLVAEVRGKPLIAGIVFTMKGVTIYRMYGSLKHIGKELRASEATLIELLERISGDVERVGR